MARWDKSGKLLAPCAFPNPTLPPVGEGANDSLSLRGGPAEHGSSGARGKGGMGEWVEEKREDIKPRRFPTWRFLLISVKSKRE